MAIAVNGGHVSRALDFYETVGKYFIIGGTTPWDDETTPDTPALTDFRLKDVVGLKRVENVQLVVPDEHGAIQYRQQNWRVVTPHVESTIGDGGVTVGSTVIPLTSVAGVVVGARLRVNNTYEGVVTNITGLLVTLDTASPADIPKGSPVLGGAYVEGAKYVYVDCYLNYDEFPLVTYRQIGLCTGVVPNTPNVMVSGAYTQTGNNEYDSLGTLEILDNRVPSTRDISQREMLSLIVEF